MSIDALRQQVEAARMQNELHRLTAANRLLTQRASLQETFGAWVDRKEYLYDGQGYSDFGYDEAGLRPAVPNDRKDGDHYPYWTSVTEHRQVVAMGRHIATDTEVGSGALSTLVNYVVGNGFEYDVRPNKHGGDKVVAAAVQQVVDQFLEDNPWEYDLEREAFLRSREEGEAFLCLAHRGGLSVEVSIPDVTRCSEPDRADLLEDHHDLPPGLSWTYGLASEPGRSDRIHAYFFESSDDQPEGWDLYSAGQVEHIKLNVPRTVKRGMSDFFPNEETIRRSDKLLGNTLEGSAVQAAIAYIREHSEGTDEDGIRSLVTGMADDTSLAPRIAGGKNQSRSVIKHPPGSVHDVTAGMKYHAGPLGNVNNLHYIDVVQAGLRIAGIRWNMPEYMISGDASNGNFASTLVAESPFTKFAETQQRRYGEGHYVNMLWRVVGLVAPYHPVLAGLSVRQMKRLCQITATGPEIAVRNRLEEHQIRVDEYTFGILAAETWAAEAGRDLDEEQAKGAKPQAVESPPTGASPTGPAVASPQPMQVPEWRSYP